MKLAFAIGLLLVGGAGVAMYVANASSSPTTRTTPFPPPLFDEELAEAGGFAADRPAPLDIDGKRFMTYLQAVCDIGPRMSGTSGMRKQQDLIIAHFDKLGLAVRKQTFQAKQVSRQDPIEFTNLIVSIFPEKKKRVILCSHYDTRPHADQEEDPRKWREPFVSANDGGSGVAFLMELGHHLPKLKLDVGIDFVLFDGEEFVFKRDEDKYFIGSEHFAQTWRKSDNRPDYSAAILFDMIAGKEPRFPAERNAFEKAPDLNKAIWRIASEQKSRTFQQKVRDGYVLDDHLELLKVGIPAIDIIDFDYKHWHRLGDRPESCDPEGPTEIARVLGVWLPRQK